MPLDADEERAKVPGLKLVAKGLKLRNEKAEKLVAAALKKAKSNPLRNTLTVAGKRMKAKPQQAPAEISSVEYNKFLSIFKSIKGKDMTPNVVAMLGKLKNPEQIAKYKIFYKAITSKT
ncbi:hypothetical protein PC129_g23621 [Phytophthora cactorum]|uniref:RxLR effector protein n=1 Tax=Phytophthora cactorum TaxID=29920 RepID=A0A329RJC3_9STRA|nr:hypothetical protein GQ600_12407 [Phytophthora cactorum]KAG2789705.1 hypothetical protein Pcac1_g1476 [Phytophthora cactorum]KAG2790009.1 hypothetical protein Pcac1_g1465 [Phytophthora cactorum]KAG2792084.1 hypothetical protein PC112_g24003 [Phytophthora cactorum]KAG2809900.1 hypothetical protein PC113_g23826 [Phytophthora cactorum]